MTELDLGTVQSRDERRAFTATNDSALAGGFPLQRQGRRRAGGAGSCTFSLMGVSWLPLK